MTRLAVALVLLALPAQAQIRSEFREPGSQRLTIADFMCYPHQAVHWLTDDDDTDDEWRWQTCLAWASDEESWKRSIEKELAGR